MNSIPVVLSIAGTDPSGGAGISADIKAISATGSYAAAVITALVAQNTQGVQEIFEIPSDFLYTQLKSVFDDLTISAIKIGMLHRKSIIDVVGKALREYRLEHVVFDPVMVAKDGSVLLNMDTITGLKTNIFPYVSLITPNLVEANHLLQTTIDTAEQMANAAKHLGDTHGLNVLVKGGHLNGQESKDVLYLFQENTFHWYEAKRIHTKNTHGTGCSLSSAIASWLAQGFFVVDAVAQAKNYMTHAIASGSQQTIGKGNGPVDHFYFLENRQYDVF